MKSLKRIINNSGLTLRHSIGLILALLLFFIPFITQSRYYFDIFITTLLYALLGSSWNILGGYCGQISLGHALYFGLGGYASAVLFMKFGIPPLANLFIVPFFVALVAMILGYPSLKLKGLYFVFFTIALAAAVRTLFINWEYVGAAKGIYVPFKPSIVNLTFHSKTSFYFLIYGLTMICIGLTFLIKHSRLGRYFIAIRENEVQAKALGINTALYKTYSFGISAAMAAVGGIFYTQYVLYLSPGSTMDLHTSLWFMLIPLLGGAGTEFGPLVGALLLIPAREYIRGTVGGQIGGLATLLTGLVLMVVAVGFPKGLMGYLKSSVEGHNE